MFGKYFKILDALKSIIPPSLKGITITKYDEFNGCIEVEPFGMKAVVSNGVIYNYPVDISKDRLVNIFDG